VVRWSKNAKNCVTSFQNDIYDCEFIYGCELMDDYLNFGIISFVGKIITELMCPKSM